MKQKSKRFWTWPRVERVLLALFAIAFFSSMIYAAFRPASHDTVTFQVTGVTGSINASSLVSIHFECIKYCISHVENSREKECWDECTKLGKEACP